ncbi:MAG: DNA-binding response regulator [Alteromonadaceae bacterium]|nr:MAG: DNA-binding response regulator [Alteromonadaceae bacterium]
MLNILLIDDHAVVRSGMKLILDEAFSPVEFGEAADSVQALTKLRQQKWDLVLLDISLPDASGVQVLKKIQIHDPMLPVLVLSNYPESQYAVRLLRAGAAGYLSKDSDEDEIIKAVRQACNGRKYISDAVAELLACQLKRPEIASENRHEMLSNREYEIFLELAEGNRVTDIADKLSISSKTVSTHRARIFQKMNFPNNAGLVIYASENSLRG